MDGSGTIALWKSGAKSSASTLSDSVGPVLVASALRFARLGDQDTLAMLFSEPVSASTGSEWLLHIAGLDLGATAPVFVSGATWHYPIPAGTVVAGDSVKVSATSRWVDLSSGRRAPVGHPWIPVFGGERAPFQGWYSDEDGDAAVDHIHILFQKAAPKTRPGFSISLPGVPKIVVDSGTWTLDASGMGATIPVGPLAKNTTVFGTSASGTWKSMGIETDFPIYDSVAPVLVSASLRYADADSVPDTLKVRWSEPLQGLSSISPVVHGSRNRRLGGLGLSTLDNDGFGASILVWADSIGIFRGDSAQLDGVGAGIADRNGNIPGPNYGWVPVKIGLRPIRLDFKLKNFLEAPLGIGIPGVPPLSVMVRARPERGAVDTAWVRLDGFAGVEERNAVHLTMTTNRPFDGGAYLFDNLGVFVFAVDLSALKKMADAGTLPMDGSGMFQVRIAWDGRDQSGKDVVSGVYWMRLVLKEQGGEDEPVKMLNKVFGFGIKRPK